MRPRLCASISVTLPRYTSIPPKWKHIRCAQLLPTRKVQVPPLREQTILLVQSLVQELVLFLNREPLFFPRSNLGNPYLTGLVTLILLTATSCIINTVSQYFCGIQDGRRNPTNIIAATCGRFHAVIFQEASDHVLPHLRSVHCVHWQHGRRHLAQQGHFRA